MAVRMYTVYKDLAADSSTVRKMQELQTARDRVLYQVFLKKKIPAFPIDKQVFEEQRPKFEEISKHNKMLCFLFEYDDKCYVLNQGSYSEHKNMIEAHNHIFNVKDVDATRIISKYYVS